MWLSITDWISDCLENHAECSLQKPKHHKYPTRLVFVGSNEDYSDVRICDQVEPNERYMTLSHRWDLDGGSVKLLENNVHEFSTQLPWERLPSTFKDAINAVRKLSSGLNVNYIWIDALCIIQDSSTDKEREIKIMGSIYQNSLCNLAACPEREGQFNVLQDHSTLNLHECVLPVGPRHRPDLRFRIDHWDLYKKLVTQTTLNSRAWVLQELVLAPRIVYFTPQQLIWECTEACYYQSSPQRNRRRDVAGTKSYALVQKSEEGSMEDPDITHYQFWFGKLWEYSGRKLTYESDKLHAISAIARLVQTRLEERDEYMVGCWKRRLHLQLLWQCVDKPEPFDASVDPPGRRPSWSWISVNGAVINFHTDKRAIQSTQPMLSLAPRVRYVDENNRFGDASSAELDATGIVFKVSLDVKWKETYQQGKNFALGARLATDEVQDSEKFTQSFITTLDVFVGKPEEGQSIPMWAYFLFVTRRSFSSTRRRYLGLVLSRLGHGRGLYRRVGTFMVDPEDWREGILEEMQALCPLAEEDYVERMPDRSHKITIL